jgi:hypothetical protein
MDFRFWILDSVSSSKTKIQNLKSKRALDRLDQHVELGVGPQTDLDPRQADDAGISPAEHLDLDAVSQSELFQAVDVVGVSEDAMDACRLAGGQIAQGNQLVHEVLRETGS